MEGKKTIKGNACKSAWPAAAMAILCLAIARPSMAQSSATSAPAPGSTAGAAPAAKPIFLKCAEQNNITLPTPGSGQFLSTSQRHEIRQCVRTARHAARETCAEKNDISLPTPGSGDHLTRIERKTMWQCMKAAGFGRRFARHYRNWNTGTNSSTSAG